MFVIFGDGRVEVASHWTPSKDGGSTSIQFLAFAANLLEHLKPGLKRFHDIWNKFDFLVLSNEIVLYAAKWVRKLGLCGKIWIAPALDVLSGMIIRRYFKPDGEAPDGWAWWLEFISELAVRAAVAFACSVVCLYIPMSPWFECLVCGAAQGAVTLLWRPARRVVIPVAKKVMGWFRSWFGVSSYILEMR
ncbi:hypothetical protein CPB85DRAFT_1463603 [Mucidula mucida]|nr:hypothetical protein CPB85DRAFT_1463603 [Mucidula mucida]